MKWVVFGHEQVKHVLEQQLTSGALAHAYLFTGPSGVGKGMLAKEFAHAIRGSSGTAFDTDISEIFVTPEFGVEQMREVLARLKFKPRSGLRTVTIIHNADLLNTQSSNSLLKTLEEPVPSAIVILISSTRGLLPTIISRCQVFPFNRFSVKEITSFVTREKLSVTPDIIEYASGSIGKLRTLQENPDVVAEYAKYDTAFVELQKRGVGARMAEVHELARLSEDALTRMLDTWLTRYMSQHSVTQAGLEWIRSVCESKGQLHTPINKKLIIEKVLLTLPSN